MTTRSARALLPTLLLVLAACGDRLVDASYRGVPLGALSGSMVPAPGVDVQGPVRLAIAWYPQWLAAADPASADAPPAIVTEEVEAEGTFPVDFRFPLYGPPPSSALAPLGEGLLGRGAFGVLLAYQDLDGDRRLSPIPRYGKPVDRIIGSSLLGDPSSTFALVYVDRAQPAGTGLVPGLNLVKAAGAETTVVPLDTRVRLSLTEGGPVYDAFVCLAGWLTFLLDPVCGLSGELPSDGPPGFGYDGRVALDGTRLEVELRVTSQEAFSYPDAVVSVNGRRIPWDAGWGAFRLSEADTALVRPGGQVLVSVTAANTSRGRVFTMPAEFSIEKPAELETVSAAGPLRLEWSASPGTTTWFGGFEAPPAGYATITESADIRFLDLDTTWAGIGAASAFVEARVDGVDGEAFVTTALVRRRSFWFVP
ncbi:MAG: hypothetical protein U0229_21010 [Anaeromyxobacter sp.]